MSSEDSEPVKKEALSDDNLLSAIRDNKKKNSANVSKNAAASDAKSRAKQTKVKKEEPGRGGSASSGSRSKATKVNKEEWLTDEEEVDDKPISKRRSAAVADKKETKKKNKKEEVKKAASGKDGKEKKVYELPGQKRDAPEERDPLRIFYETLYKQVPHSEMAQIWMMESGLLPLNEAKKVFEKKQKKKLTTPIKSVSAAKSITKTATVKKNVVSSPVSSTRKKTVETKVAAKQSKKRKADDESSDDGSDDDFVMTKTTKKQRVK